jgi:hypothetical protein
MQSQPILQYKPTYEPLQSTNKQMYFTFWAITSSNKINAQKKGEIIGKTNIFSTLALHKRTFNM